MLGIIMNRAFIARWTRMPHSTGRLSASPSSHHSLSSAAFITNIAESDFRHAQPGGLAFSEFRGYEGWQVVAISQNDKLVAAILANPVMIDAYLAGIPGNGKP